MVARLSRVALLCAVGGAIAAHAKLARQVGSSASPQGSLALTLLAKPHDQRAGAAWNDLVDATLPSSVATGVRDGSLVLVMMHHKQSATASAVFDDSTLSFRSGTSWFSQGMVYVQHAEETAIPIATPVEAQSSAVMGRTLTLLANGARAGRVSFGGAVGDLGSPGSGMVAVSVGQLARGDVMDARAAMAWLRWAGTAGVAVRQPVEPFPLNTCGTRSGAGSTTDATAAFFRRLWLADSAGQTTPFLAVPGHPGHSCVHQIGQPLYPLRAVPHVLVHPTPSLPTAPKPAKAGQVSPESGLLWNVSMAVAEALVRDSNSYGGASRSHATIAPAIVTSVWSATLATPVTQEPGSPWQVVSCVAPFKHFVIHDWSNPLELSQWMADDAKKLLAAQSITEPSLEQLHAASTWVSIKAIMDQAAEVATSCVDAGTWVQPDQWGALDATSPAGAAAFARQSYRQLAATPALATLRRSLLAVPWLTALSRLPIPDDPERYNATDDLFVVLNFADAATRESLLTAQHLAPLALTPSLFTPSHKLFASPPASEPQLFSVPDWPDPLRAADYGAASAALRGVAPPTCLEITGTAPNAADQPALSTCQHIATNLNLPNMTSASFTHATPESLEATSGLLEGAVPSGVVAVPALNRFRTTASHATMSRLAAAVRFVWGQGAASLPVVRIDPCTIITQFDRNPLPFSSEKPFSPAHIDTAQQLRETVAQGATRLSRGNLTSVALQCSGLNNDLWEQSISLAEELARTVPSPDKVPAGWGIARAHLVRRELMAERSVEIRRRQLPSSDAGWPAARALRRLGKTLSATAQFRDMRLAGSQLPQLDTPPRRGANRGVAWGAGEFALADLRKFTISGRQTINIKLLVDRAASLLRHIAAAPTPAERAARTRPLWYGEIGCRDDATFASLRDRVRIAVSSIPGISHADAAALDVRRIGVDPQSGGNLRMTSDEFFADPRFRNVRFDVLFVDGLHEGQQALRDVENGIARLYDGGFITMHDIGVFHRLWQSWPPAGSGHPSAGTIFEGTDTRPDMWPHYWNGDTWRAMAVLLTREDVDPWVVEADFGVGVVAKRPNPHPIELDVPALPRSRTLGAAGRFEVVRGESDAERRALEATARRSPLGWSDDGARPLLAATYGSEPDSLGHFACDGYWDWKSRQSLVAAGADRHESDATVLEMLQAASADDYDAFFGTERPLLAHPVVRCLRGELGQSMDDLRLKEDIPEGSSSSSRLLDWNEWASTMSWRVRRLAVNQVRAWAAGTFPARGLGLS